MRRRAPSPAGTGEEVDILDSLVDGEFPLGRSTETANRDAEATDFDFGGLLNGYDAQANQGDQNGEEDGDEAFIALQQAASFRKTSQASGVMKKKRGGFQSMGLNPALLKAITRKGFSIPTPIQRKTMPLILDRKDVVGMARTGSGKTAAFVIPMIERLRAHSAQVGARALVLSPSRELALQTLKVVKEFGRGTDLKSVLLVGGDSLEEQFSLMASNPDIVIATPGRFLHLKIEMSLPLTSMQYVVFDEADRLFEQGFAPQLTEILHALPAARQTLLFSATLPSSLVDFARAGLQDPSLVRLDAESSLSPDLESAFFSVKGADKEGAMLYLLQSVIKMPLGIPGGAAREADENKPSKKRKRGSATPNAAEKPTEHSTIIFAATRHHVEYLASLLKEFGFAVSYVYGSLDQTARMLQVEDFRRGRTNILVVTDVAARGIDIPILANVINYDFTVPKVFIHRVGRTARAGQRGWSWSLIRDVDVPYLVDLQLLLGRRLVLGRETGAAPSYTEDMVVGALPRSAMEPDTEWVNKLVSESADISALRSVVDKAERLYLKTRSPASSQSARRAKEITSSRGWSQLNRLFDESADAQEDARTDMLARIGGFKPQETIFEIGNKGKRAQNEAAEVMKTFRAKVGPRRSKAAKEVVEDQGQVAGLAADIESVDDGGSDRESGEGLDESAELEDEEVEVTVSSTAAPRDKSSFKDADVFMSYTPKTINTAAERGYGVDSGSRQQGFVEAAREVTMDLNNDEVAKSFGLPTRQKMRWDKKSAKYVATANDEDGSRGAGSKMMRGESGVKIAASFQSGRFDRWRKAHRLGKLPQVGESERRVATLPAPAPFHYKHKMEKAPKDADKFRDDYHVRKRRVQEAKEKRVGKYSDGAGSNARELRSALDIRKERKLKEQRRAKNARPAKQKSRS